jgi:hypothetical protein
MLAKDKKVEKKVEMLLVRETVEAAVTCND